MALQTADPSHATSAQTVGNDFVKQYYHLLHNFPEQIQKLYQDSSVLSWPGLDDKMTSVTTMKGINDNILLSEFKYYKAEIATIDAQDSCNEKGVIVLVTGCLTGKDDLRMKFTQTFFLTQQDNSYYALNDIFRFVDGNEQPGFTPLAVDDVDESAPTVSVTPDQGSMAVDDVDESAPTESVTPDQGSMAVNDVDESAPTAPLTPEPEDARSHDHTMQNHASSPSEEDSNDDRKARDPSDIKGSLLEIDEGSDVRDIVVAESPVTSSHNDASSVPKSASDVQESSQKMSYASILAKKSTVTSPVHVATSTIVRVAPSSTGQSSHASVAPKATAPRNNSVPQSSNDQAEVNGIYVGNLPTDVTVQQLEAVFKMFGPIKQEGIQIRKFEEDGFCFGFVEFESSDAVHSAIEARKVTVGEKTAYIEKRRTVTRGKVHNPDGIGRWRFSSGRDGNKFRGDDNSRGRGKFGGGGRNQQRTAAANQGVLQNGSGRVGRQGGMK
ncbi:nuclear transport factor 2-like isoform X1 [Cornus florida]|uniref:nuclear transport factor 2-like isoform X1 n=1 Tax=Cornus florida TaxID=4283 RepID=UPI00289F8E9F|nr:nuclear transport factor 2-like isoform X1 [Cornus florida]